MFESKSTKLKEDIHWLKNNSLEIDRDDWIEYFI